VKEGIELQALLHEFPDSVAVSARGGEGLEDLRSAIECFIDRGLVTVEISLRSDSALAGRVRAAIMKDGRILEEMAEDGLITMCARLRSEDLGRLGKISGVEVRRL
jgi:50S ribosomal subunit-associated GTPase HflX